MLLPGIKVKTSLKIPFNKLMILLTFCVSLKSMPRKTVGCLPTINNYLLILLLPVLTHLSLWLSTMTMTIKNFITKHGLIFSKLSGLNCTTNSVLFHICIIWSQQKVTLVLPALEWHNEVLFTAKIIEEMGHLTESVDDAILSLVGITAHQHCIHYDDHTALKTQFKL